MARHEAAGLTVEKNRLIKTIRGTFSGIVGDRHHSFGYHLPAAELPSSDYSMQGSYNRPDDRYASCAIDIGMDWPASRQWLAWLIAQIRSGKITGVVEVIGSLNADGSNVRYWSITNTPTWPPNGQEYDGDGHDTWSHVSIGRSQSKKDHGILKGWTRTGYEGSTGEDTPMYVSLGCSKTLRLTAGAWSYLKFDKEYSDKDNEHGAGMNPSILRKPSRFVATVTATMPGLPAGSQVHARFVQVAKHGATYRIVNPYPCCEVPSTRGNTYVNFSQVGSVARGTRLRVQLRVYLPSGVSVPVTAAEATAKVLHWHT